MSLDDKLREIIVGVMNVPKDMTYAGDFIGDTILPRLKEAFAYDNYVQAAEFIKENNLMTGQVWYDRFVKEIDEVSWQNMLEVSDGRPTTIVALEAAKKASGIE